MDAEPPIDPAEQGHEPQSPIQTAAMRRPRLLNRIEARPSRAERARATTRRALRITAITVGALAILVLIILARAQLESRWTLPETRITARVEEDLYYNITYDRGSDDILGINYTTDQIIHLGDPLAGIEGVQARVERSRTGNRDSYQLKNDRDILVASATQVRVANRPLFDKTALISHVEHGFLVGGAEAGRSKEFSLFELRGERLHEQSRAAFSPAVAARLANIVFETSEFWGWFGDRFRAGTRLVEVSRLAPTDLVDRLEREHQEFHDQQKFRLANPFDTLDELSAHTRPLYVSDEGLPGPWWQLDALPQGSTMHLAADRDGRRKKTIHISWDKTGIFPWRWLNGGYRAKDEVGELFRIQIKDYWFHFPNQLTYLYFLDLNGDGHIDRDQELIGQVAYSVADSPLKETLARSPDVPLTQENTQEFTRNKTYRFRVGADPARADEDFRLCDGIEKLLPDAISKGFGRDSHLGYIERARDDFLLSTDLNRPTLHGVVTIDDALGWKTSVLELLRAAKRPYADELERYWFEDPEFPRTP